MSADPIQHYRSQFHSSNKRIHMNNAGLAPISAPASQRVQYWAKNFYELGYFSDSEYMSEVHQSRSSLAQLIGCSVEEIAYFQNTSSAISQLALEFPLQPSDEVLMWDQEYSSNLYPWQEACKRSGAKLIFAKSESNLSLKLENLISKITSKTKVIAISWVQFQTGALTDIQKLAEVSKKNGVFLFVDAIQGLGLLSMQMKSWGISAVAGGSHKWLTSPVGVGFLALNKNFLEQIRPHNIGSSTFGTCDDPASLFCSPKTDAGRYESGSKQVLEIVALGASVDLILKTSVDRIYSEVQMLSERLHLGLSDLKYQVYREHASIVNFVPKNDSQDRLKKINCNFALRGPGIRLSPHAFNTTNEIDLILNALS